MPNLKLPSLIAALLVGLVASGCGGGESDNAPTSPVPDAAWADGSRDGGARPTPTPTPTANVAVTFPNLFVEGGQKVLPTYISHLVTSSPFQLVAIKVQNTGSAPTSYAVTVDLPTYGSPARETISVAAGQEQAVKISPSINFTSLFALTTAVPGNINVTVASGSTTLHQQSYPIQISGRDTVFWSSNGQSTVGVVAAMVTPHDKNLEIARLAHEAGLLFPGGSLLGYQEGGTYPAATVGAISPGKWATETLNVIAGDVGISVMVDAVQNGLGGADTAVVMIMDAANFATWSSGSNAMACGINNAAAAGATISCTPSAAGTFYVVYYNPYTNITSRTVTRRRTMTHIESSYEQTRAIFTALRNREMIYANLPGTGFFSASQSIMFPSESLAVNNANCIEGSLVFASLWEAMGMEPIILVDFAHGHAFTAVRCWTGTANCVLPIETTAVGKAGIAYDQAYSTASSNWTTWGPSGDNSADFVDVKALRAAGITPAPM